MLRPMYRDWYPGLRSDQWFPAKAVADYVLAQRESGEWRLELGARVLSSEHFLFRGGSPRAEPMARGRQGDFAVAAEDAG